MSSMAPVDEIQSFLTEKSEYSYGVHLLSLVNPNTRLIHYLMRTESKMNWEQLIYELKKYLKNNPQKVKKHGKEKKFIKQESSSQPKHERVKSRSVTPIHIKPTEVRKEKELLVIPSTDRSNSVANNKSLLLSKVKDKRILLYRSRSHLHGRLHEAPTDEIRKRLAGDIINIQFKIDSINKDLNAIESGTIPREIVLDVMTANQHKEFRNFQNYVVRYRNYLKKENLTADEKSRYQAKLDEYTEKLENYFAYV